MIYAFAITIHFIFDWILQPRKIALTKAIDIKAWYDHMIKQVIPYIAIIFLTLIFVIDSNQYNGSKFGIMIAINIFSHGIIDWNLSKIYPPHNERGTINLTAIDQILHLTILILSIEYIIS